MLKKLELPDNTDDAILIDEVVEFNFGDRKELKHRVRRIACWSEKSQRVCSFTGIVSLLRLQLMSYISLFDLLKKPERAWLNLLEKQRREVPNTLFPV